MILVDTIDQLWKHLDKLFVESHLSGEPALYLFAYVSFSKRRGRETKQKGIISRKQSFLVDSCLNLLEFKRK